MLDKLIFLVALAGTAVVFADVLVREGMLLVPVQRWLREKHLRWFIHHDMRAHPELIGSDSAMRVRQLTDAYYACQFDLDNRWWAKMGWFCYKCVAGQWGFWGYLLRYHSPYNLFEHVAFTAFTIIAAIIIQKWTE